jgi:transcriptional regulator with XRE-family HTH domain
MGMLLADEKQDTTGFGPRLRSLREAANLSQRQLAEMIGVVYQNIARLERGDRSPSWKTVVKLAEALGVSTDEFKSEPADEPPAPGDAPPEGKRPRPKAK